MSSKLSNRSRSIQSNSSSSELEVTPYPTSSRSSPNNSPFKWRQKTSPLAPQELQKNVPVPHGYLIDDDTLNILTNNIEASSRPRQLISPERQPFYKKNKNSKEHRVVIATPLNEGIEPKSSQLSPNRFANPRSKSIYHKDSLANLRTFQSPEPVKNFKGFVCAFCGEPLQYFLVKDGIVERLVEFRCGHSSHEECYKVALEFASIESESISKEEEETRTGISASPKCRCGEQAVPLDTDISEKILSQNLLDVSSKILSKHLNDPRNPSTSIIRPRPSILNLKNSRDFTSSHARGTSRGSSISAISSIISSISRSPTPSPTSASNALSLVSDQMSPRSRAPLALMRSRLLSNLLENCSQSLGESKNISESLIDSLGVLRLLDELFIFFGQDEQPRLHNCYLFSYLLLIIEEGYYNYKLISLIEDGGHDLSSARAPIKIVQMESLVLKAKIGHTDEFCLSATAFNVLDKWHSALVHPDLIYPSEIISNTLLVEDAKDSKFPFGQFLVKPKTKRKALNKVQLLDSSRDVYTISPPRSIILIINQLRLTQSVIVILKNIIRALFLLKIDVLVIFSSIEMLQFDSVYLAQKFFSFTYEEEKYDAFWENLDENLVKNGKGDSLESLSSDFLKTTKHNIKHVSTVVISNLPIGSTNFSTSNNLFLEVGVLHNPFTTKKEKVVSIASWDDAMEKICSNIGLDFDIINSSETENDTDAASVKARVSTLTIHDNGSTTSTATESDSDAEVISKLLSTYEDIDANVMRTPSMQEMKSFDDQGDGFIEGIDNSALTPKVRLTRARVDYDSNLDDTPRWSRLFSDIDRALEDSRHG